MKVQIMFLYTYRYIYMYIIFNVNTSCMMTEPQNIIYYSFNICIYLYIQYYFYKWIWHVVRSSASIQLGNTIKIEWFSYFKGDRLSFEVNWTTSEACLENHYLLSKVFIWFLICKLSSQLIFKMVFFRVVCKVLYVNTLVI